MLPSTSSASSGAAMLIPTLLSSTLSTVVGIPFLLTCKSTELPADEL